MLSIPINFPFTRFNRSLKARLQIKTLVLNLIKERREKLEQQTIFAQHDLISTLLSLKNDDNSSSMLTDEEIVDNIIVIMIAGHDTTSVLLSLMIKLLANEPSVCANVVQGNICKFSTRNHQKITSLMIIIKVFILQNKKRY